MQKKTILNKCREPHKTKIRESKQNTLEHEAI